MTDAPGLHEPSEFDLRALLEAARWAPSAGSSRTWAPDAGILVANLCQTVQATALGLASRQFRAFDRDAVAAESAVPAHWQVTTMTAFGRSRAARTDRTRRTSDDLRWVTAEERNDA